MDIEDFQPLSINELGKKAQEIFQEMEGRNEELVWQLEAERRKNQTLEEVLGEYRNELDELQRRNKELLEENAKLKSEVECKFKSKRGDWKDDGGGKKRKKDDREKKLVKEVLRTINEHANNVTSTLSPLSTSDLLSCRLVSSDWRKAVNTFLQEDNRVWVMFSLDKNLWNDPVLKTISSDNNPFPVQSLYYLDSYQYLEYKAPYRYVGQGEIRDYREEFLQFLNKFGIHFGYFTVQFGTDWDTNWYFILCQWMELMPNLKGLVLISPMRGWWEGDIEFRAGLQMLREDIATKSFPTLNNLKSISFQDCPPALMEAVLTSNSHLEKIGVKRDVRNWTEMKWSECKLDKLKEFEIINNVHCFREFDDCLNWNLEKLSVEAPRISDWTYLFQDLQKCFKETLKELELTLDNLQGKEDNDDLVLTLPNLAKLTININGPSPPLDFILPLGKLENLTVQLFQYEEGKCQDRRRKVGKSLEFFEFLDNLKKSNIWTMMPKLKKVALRRTKGYAIGRHDYPVDKSEWKVITRDNMI